MNTKQSGTMVKGAELIPQSHLLMPVDLAKSQIALMRKLIEESEYPQVIVDSIFVMSFSIIEGMLRNSLAYYLSYCPEKLPKKEINISKEMFCECNSLSFQKKIIEDQIKMLDFGALSDMYFKVLDLKGIKKDVLKKAKESKTLRNDMLHKRIRIDFKMGCAHDLENCEATDCLDNLIILLGDIEQEIESKYKEHTKINVLKSLWQQKFWSDFDIFWHVDYEKDIVLAFKTPAIEKQLSDSERFFLGIWRSQLTKYKVEFPNMSSLDPHSQSYLHLFLRISNDLFLYYSYK